MPSERPYGEWKPEEPLPRRMTAVQARDVLIDCFHMMHGPHFEQTKFALGIRADEQRVRQSVQGAVRLAFKRVDASFDAPTRDHLLRVVDVLVDRSRAWGTPDDVIDRHYNDLRRVISRVRDN